MIQLTITVQVKTVYGNETIYPICEKANLFADLLKQKTFTRRDITTIKALGYEIWTAPQPATL